MDTPLRRCTKCGGKFPPTPEYFRKNKHGSFGLSTWCLVCHRGYDSERDARLAEGKYAYRDKRRNEKREYDKQYRAKKAEERSKYNQEYHANHPEKTVSKAQRRRTRARNLPYDWTEEDWQTCLSYWNNCCCICGRTASADFRIAQEHWIPIADTRPDNPGTVPNNILPMCHAKPGAKGGCNNQKWAIDPIKWLNNRFGETQGKAIQAKIDHYFSVVKRP